MKPFKFSLVLSTCENTDVFITLDENIYGIHSKTVNILYLFLYSHNPKSQSPEYHPLFWWCFLNFNFTVSVA